MFFTKNRKNEEEKPTECNGWFIDPHECQFTGNIATLRDQFAMAALTGILANKVSTSEAAMENDVWAAYHYAKLAIKAREGVK